MPKEFRILGRSEGVFVGWGVETRIIIWRGRHGKLLSLAPTQIDSE